MARNIVNIETTQTFQNWLDKTNEMAAAFRTNAITASPTGDTTAGDATLTGNFSAENLTATSGVVSTDTIASATVNTPIEFTSAANFNGSDQVTAIFTNNLGGRVQFESPSNSIAWDVGLKDTGGNFIIDTGAAPIKFELTTAGKLTVPTIQATTFLDGNGDPFTSGSTIDNLSDIPDVSATAPSNGQVLKWDGSAWSPADDNVGTSSSGASIVSGDVNNYVITANGSGGLVGEPNMAFSGSALSVIGSGTFTTNLTTNGLLSANGTGSASNPHVANGYFKVTGDVGVTGNVSSTSDARRKENLTRIHSPLSKVMQINGYTFDWIDKPNRKRDTGLIAQEVEKVLPEAVGTVWGDDGKEWKSIQYGNMVGLLVEAIKELKEEIEELKSGRV